MPQELKISGAIPAIVTPMTKDGVELATAATLATRAATHAQAIVVAGSTGEGTSLTDAERNQLFEVTKKAIGADAVLIAGISAAATRHAVQAAVEAEAAGVDALLMSTPYYVKPGEDGILLHYQAVAEATSIPLVLYNIPSRTGSNLSSSAIIELSKRGTIAGLKEAAQNAHRIGEIAAQADPSFAIFCGDDVASLEMLSDGACGTISVVANLLPELCAIAHSHFENGNFSEAEATFMRMQPLVEQLRRAANPTAVKHAMHLLGLCSPECRLPLTSVPPDVARGISKALTRFEIDKLQQAIDGANQCKPMIYL